MPFVEGLLWAYALFSAIGVCTDEPRKPLRGAGRRFGILVQGGLLLVAALIVHAA